MNEIGKERFFILCDKLESAEVILDDSSYEKFKWINDPDNEVLTIHYITSEGLEYNETFTEENFYKSKTIHNKLLIKNTKDELCQFEIFEKKEIAWDSLKKQ